MADFTVDQMQEMQRKLQEKYKDKWEQIGPETGKNKLLWMVSEIGEVIDIVKKNGGTKASTDIDIRKGKDAGYYYMYITSDELKDAYEKKFEKNMTRW